MSTCPATVALGVGRSLTFFWIVSACANGAAKQTAFQIVIAQEVWSNQAMHLVPACMGFRPGPQCRQRER